MSIYWTWPLGAHLSSRIPHDPGDPILNAWILWWNTQAIPLTAEWWDAPFLHPLRGSLALSEHLLGISLYATPLQWAGASPLVAYNIALLLSFTLSAFFAYLLALWLTRSHLAALCAGVAFGFAPYRAGQLSHLQVLTSQWLPLMLLGLHGYLTSGRTRWLALFAACWLVQSLANGYFMLFMPVLIVLWIAYYMAWRDAWTRAGAIAIAWTAASVPLLPIVLKYREVHGDLGLGRSAGDIRQFSASLASFMHAPPLLAVWPAGAPQNQEHYLFPGVTAPAVVVLALIVVAMRRQLRMALHERSPLLFYAVATVVMWAMTLGPGPEAAGATGLLYPYRWLWWLPGFDGLRVPARFAMLGSFCLGTATSLAFVRLRPSSQALQVAFGAIVLGGLAIDGLTETMPIAAPPARVMPAGPARGAVLEIPTDDPGVSVAAMYRAMSHGRVLINGYSGHTPPHYAILSQALRRGDPSPLEYLAQGRPLTVLVHRESDPDGSFRDLVASIPGIQPQGDSLAGAMFLLPPRPRRQLPPEGDSLPIRSSWVGPSRLQIDLGGDKNLATVAIPVHRRFHEVDRRMLVEASDDGTSWREEWVGWTGALMLDAALAEPLVVTVRIPLDGARARYLRVYPAAEWMASEVTVEELRIR
jgi:hypothetical protein